LIAGGLTMHESLPVLEAGEVGTIAGVSATQIAAKRLADMGFVRGARVEMLRPGTPCLVRIGSACVGLGAAHQDSVLLCDQAEP
jgi:Fe2+ transport system protein FeoA